MWTDGRNGRTDARTTPKLYPSDLVGDNKGLKDLVHVKSIIQCSGDAFFLTFDLQKGIIGLENIL